MQVLLIFILIDVQHLQKINLSFEKGSNSPNHSSSDSHQKPQPPPPATKKIFPSPHPLNAIWKTKYSQPKWLQKITFSNNCVTKKKTLDTALLPTSIWVSKPDHGKVRFKLGFSSLQLKT